MNIKKIAQWREAYYNPLRQLTIARLAWLLEEGERGSYAQLQMLYRIIEKRDATLRAGKRRRLSALQKLDWQIQSLADSQLPAGWSASDAQAQAHTLRQAYETLDNLKEAIGFLALAEFRGFAHLEKQRDAQGRIIHLEPVPQWHWTRPGLYGPWHYDPQMKGSAHNSTPIEQSDFIIREVDDPINEIAAISFLRRSMSQKDWDGFVETYGIPPLFAEMPENVPSDKEAEYQALAEAVLADARGTLPHGARIHTIADGARGANPFQEHIRYQDELIVLAITGGKLTMLTESGSGTLAGQAHAQTFTELAEAEAETISEIFQRQFDQHILAQAFPEEPILAYFRLGADRKNDTSKTLDDLERLSRLGFTLPPGLVSELTGYPLQPKDFNPSPQSQK